jgi:hypothetical protein
MMVTVLQEWMWPRLVDWESEMNGAGIRVDCGGCGLGQRVCAAPRGEDSWTKAVGQDSESNGEADGCTECTRELWLLVGMIAGHW